MALQYSPKIVTDSLVMCLDASNNKSYPTDLPVKNGLVMWMDAADDTTFSYSSGTTVSQWRDKSGSNYHMTPVSAGPTRNAFLNSRKVLAFTTAQQIWNSSINLVTSAYTVFCVTRLSGTTPSRVLSTQYTGNLGGNWLLGHWGGYVNQYFAEGWIAYAAYAADNTWRMYMGDWGGPSNDIADAFSNGTSIRNQPSADASAGPLGLGINISSEVSTCEAAEIVVFNRLLSTTERKQVHTYLGQKWGISNTDRSIVDLSGLDDNGLFGNGTVANMPLYDYYNKGAFKFFANNKYIKLGISTVVNQFAGDFAVSLWAMATAENSNYGNLIGDWYTAGTNTLNEWQIMMNNSSTFLVVYHHTAGTPISARSSGFSANTWINVVLSRVGSTLTLYANNNAIGTVTNSSIFGSTTGNVNIGIDGDSSSERFTGLISNVLIYRKGLSAAEVAQNYEAQKSKFANTIVQQGLVLNLDAGNPYSYAGAGTAWYDVSGNTKDFIIDGSGITYNSGGYFTLADGGITRSATITNSTTCTVVVWIRTTDTQALIFKGNSNASFYLAAYNAGSGFYNENCGSPTYWIDTLSVANPNPTYLDGNWHMWEMKNVNFSSWTSYEFNKYGSYTFGNGAVGHIMIYDRNLSSGESLQIYNATKGRFGL